MNLDKFIRKNFKTALLNDSQWLKIMYLMVENFSIIKRCNVKLVWENQEIVRELKVEEYSQFEFDFYDDAIEGLISGFPRRLYDYKEIEWLEFPRTFIDHKSIFHEQSLSLLKEMFDSIGEFHIELSDDRLKLYAYLPL